MGAAGHSLLQVGSSFVVMVGIESCLIKNGVCITEVQWELMLFMALEDR